MESVPGGSSCIYLSNIMIRTTTSTKLDEDSTYGVKGFMVTGEFVKSRSSEAGRKFDMVFVQSSGFDNVLTNLANFKELGLLKGSPRAYYLEELPDIKFTLKTFKQKYEENEELRELVEKLVKENYVKFIPNYDELITKSNIEEEDESNSEDEDVLELIECVDEEKDIWLASDGKYYTSDGENVKYKKTTKK